MSLGKRSSTSTAMPIRRPGYRNTTYRTSEETERITDCMLILSKYSFGVGDRFAHQAKSQLQACILAAEQGVEVIPVWNKSNREHTTIGSQPPSVRTAADAAVQE